MADVARVSMTFMCLLRQTWFRQAWFSDAVFGCCAGRIGVKLVLPLAPPFLDRADDALRQQQRHQNEQCAEHEQPVRREETGREHGLGVINDDRAKRRAGQRAAAADRDPDDGLDGVAGRKFTGIDDADLRHVQRTGDAGHAGRQREHEQFVVLDTVAEKPRAGFRVTDGNQHLAELRGHDGAADQERNGQRNARQDEQYGARALRLDVEAENVLEVGQAVVAAKAKIIAEERQQQRVGHRLRDDRQINAGHP